MTETKLTVVLFSIRVPIDCSQFLWVEHQDLICIQILSVGGNVLAVK